MKIDNVYPYDISQQHKPAASDPGPAGGRQAADDVKVSGQQEGTSDTVVHFSEASRTAHAVREAVAASPDLRAEKVDALKKAVASGGYHVDPAAVADKLVDTLLDDV